VRLLGALLMEQDEAWTTGHRYFEMTAYWQSRSTNQEEGPLAHSA
jgi:putative transposase